jgi:hypothetical protein
MANVKSGGVSTLGVIGIVFVILKLCKLITWSWWWVTIPFWGGIALFGLFFLIGILIAMMIR